jgi:hypothetical protein
MLRPRIRFLTRSRFFPFNRTEQQVDVPNSQEAGVNPVVDRLCTGDHRKHLMPFCVADNRVN